MELNASNIVVLCLCLVLMVVIVHNVTSSSTVNQTSLNSYRIDYVNNPSEGTTIMVDGKIFEYTTNPNLNNGNIPVLINSNVSITANNLKSAISNNTEVSVW
jgi:hypothetical protein